MGTYMYMFTYTFKQNILPKINTKGSCQNSHTLSLKTNFHLWRKACKWFKTLRI